MPHLLIPSSEGSPSLRPEGSPARPQAGGVEKAQGVSSRVLGLGFAKQGNKGRWSCKQLQQIVRAGRGGARWLS